eukprot:GHVS01071498.1.p1 GENE.GHVS01071498.1~~GHVS01071498.1.p1  ORF type:complete len:749 (+),score=92.91 GHVS01071498.1:28-2274(+)
MENIKEDGGEQESGGRRARKEDPSPAEVSFRPRKRVCAVQEHSRHRLEEEENNLSKEETSLEQMRLWQTKRRVDRSKAVRGQRPGGCRMGMSGRSEENIVAPVVERQQHKCCNFYSWLRQSRSTSPRRLTESFFSPEGGRRKKELRQCAKELMMERLEPLIVVKRASETTAARHRCRKGGYRTCFGLKGHDGCVNGMQFCPKGEYLVSGSDDRHLIVWKICEWNALMRCRSDTGKRVVPATVIRTDHSLNIFSCEFDADRKWLLSSSHDGSVIRTEIENPNTSVTVRRQRGLSSAYEAHFIDSTADKALACFDTGTIKLFDFRDNSPGLIVFSSGSRLQQESPVYSIGVHDAHQFKVVATTAAATRMLDLRMVAGSRHATDLIYQNSKSSSELSADRLTEHRSHEESVENLSGANRAHFSWDGKMLLLVRAGTNSNERSFLRKSTEFKKTNWPLVYPSHLPLPVYELKSTLWINEQTLKSGTWLPDGLQIAIGSDNFQVHVWRLPGGPGSAAYEDLVSSQQTEILQVAYRLNGHESIVNCCVSTPPFSDSMPYLATSGIEKVIRLWTPERVGCRGAEDLYADADGQDLLEEETDTEYRLLHGIERRSRTLVYRRRRAQQLPLWWQQINTGRMVREDIPTIQLSWAFDTTPTRQVAEWVRAKAWPIGPSFVDQAAVASSDEDSLFSVDTIQDDSSEDETRSYGDWLAQKWNMRSLPEIRSEDGSSDDEIILDNVEEESEEESSLDTDDD